MPAIRLLDTEHQTELAYLHEQLIEGEPVQDKSWRYAEEYLMQLGIYNVILVRRKLMFEIIKGFCLRTGTVRSGQQIV